MVQEIPGSLDSRDLGIQDHWPAQVTMTLPKGLLMDERLNESPKEQYPVGRFEKSTAWFGFLDSAWSIPEHLKF